MLVSGVSIKDSFFQAAAYVSDNCGFGREYAVEYRCSQSGGNGTLNDTIFSLDSTANYQVTRMATITINAESGILR